MDRPTHVKFAPIFTLGVSTLLFKIFPLAPNLPLLAQVAISVGASNITAMAPDADLHSYKPYYVIWDLKKNLRREQNVDKSQWGARNNNNRRKKKNKKASVYYINGKEYRSPSTTWERIWATIFRLMGCRHHRAVQSHSPDLWIPIWLVLVMMCKIASITFRNQAFDILTLVMFGMGAGYTSHLVGDFNTKGGLPFLFTGGNTVSPMRRIFGKIPILKNLPKANNPIWTSLFLYVSSNLVLMLFFPQQVIEINKQLIVGIYTIIKSSISAIMSMKVGA